MAPRKSVSTLEGMCWKIAVCSIENKNQQQQAALLPKYFMDQLYKRSSEDVSKILPSKLFLHPKTTELLTLQFDIRSEEKLVKKISRVCKNLRRIVAPRYIFSSHNFLYQPKSLLSIIVNNPLLTYLDLYGSTCFTDDHLLLVSEHCSQLQHLNLKCIRDFTDDSMDHLPATLTFLNVHSTNITPNGCLIALNRLKSLKELKYQKWTEVLRLLPRQQESNFSIEYLEIFDLIGDVDFGNIIIEMFPKLRNIRLIELTNNRFIQTLGENSKLELITRLTLSFMIENVIAIGKLCPRIEELVFWVSNINVSAEVRDEVQLEFVPFKHLRKVRMSVWNYNLRLDELKLLLSNFKWLKSLTITEWRQLEDRVIYDILNENLFQNLEKFELYECGPFTLTALTELVKSLDCLTFLSIYKCENISNHKYKSLKKMIHDMNFDLYLSNQREK